MRGKRETVEHPFGTMKAGMHLLVKRLAMVEPRWRCSARLQFTRVRNIVRQAVDRRDEGLRRLQLRRLRDLRALHETQGRTRLPKTLKSRTCCEELSFSEPFGNRRIRMLQIPSAL
jgi:hypothetical protein